MGDVFERDMITNTRRYETQLLQASTFAGNTFTSQLLSPEVIYCYIPSQWHHSFSLYLSLVFAVTTTIGKIIVNQNTTQPQLIVALHLPIFQHLFRFSGDYDHRRRRVRVALSSCL